MYFSKFIVVVDRSQNNQDSRRAQADRVACRLDNFEPDDSSVGGSLHAMLDSLRFRAVRMDLEVALDTAANRYFDQLGAVQALASIVVEHLVLNIHNKLQNFIHFLSE